MRRVVPGWILALLGAAALAALIACFALGVCELAAIVGGLSAAAATALIAIIRGLGFTTRGGRGAAPTAQADEPPPPSDDEGQDRNV